METYCSRKQKRGSDVDHSAIWIGKKVAVLRSHPTDVEKNIGKSLEDVKSEEMQMVYRGQRTGNHGCLCLIRRTMRFLSCLERRWCLNQLGLNAKVNTNMWTAHAFGVCFYGEPSCWWTWTFFFPILVNQSSALISSSYFFLATEPPARLSWWESALSLRFMPRVSELEAMIKHQFDEPAATTVA